MENRNLEYFAGRLPEGKETFTRDEVAGLVHSEAQFTERTLGETMVAKADFEALQTERDTATAELATFKNAEFTAGVGTEFAKLNGDVSRTDDLIKLGGITNDMTSEAVIEKIAEIKEGGKYNFLFTEHDPSGAITNGQPAPEAPKKVSGGIIPQSGEGFWSTLFGKNK